MAASLVNSQHIALARTLPPRLMSFFKKYPPVISSSQSPAAPSPAISSVAENTSSSDPNHNTPTQLPTQSEPSQPEPQTPASNTDRRNPFLPYKHPLSGHWHGPAYSLRQQKELVKLASTHHVLSLLPWTSKLPHEAERRRAEHGLRIKGTGEGQRVKGKKWERTLKPRLLERQKAMEGMGALVKRWKELGHGRGWKKWPARSKKGR